MNPNKLTSEQVEELLKSNNLVIIDFFCLPDELANIELDDKTELELNYCSSQANQYGDAYSNPNDTSRW